MKLFLYFDLLKRMGLKYILFRFIYELKLRSGLLKRKFPTRIRPLIFPSLGEWSSESGIFFFDDRLSLNLNKVPSVSLKQDFENILEGKIPFFGFEIFDLGLKYDWVTNPYSGYKYDISKHWTEINDYDKSIGDIKYVWEKSRFCYLYTIIRYDYHFDEDHSEFVFKEIVDWIDKNPINKGPNYKCSQEISIRLLNWIFALFFYKKTINQVFFTKIIQSIYWQLNHIYNNIHFSRLAVRNNHAITETLTLYIVSVLFPQFPQSNKWRTKGKKWFEQEIMYQIYNDGTFLQFSMNYHRVVIQLLTWALRIAELNGDNFSEHVYQKAYKSLDFLYQCQNIPTGKLPNYGSNDGALFFKLSSTDYRDYRPQLDALHCVLTGQKLYNSHFEDSLWYGYSNGFDFSPIIQKKGVSVFHDGGYFLIRQEESLTFIKCGSYKDRPAHADNLHLDVWYKNENILPDGGSFKYNTDDKDLKYFMGTESHNTVMIENYDQMLKGSRFIWYYWTNVLSSEINESREFYEFKGRVSCFRYINKAIAHERTVRVYKQTPRWLVIDKFEHKPDGFNINQIWHFVNCNDLTFKSTSNSKISAGYMSEYYGQKEIISQITFKDKSSITTEITVK